MFDTFIQLMDVFLTIFKLPFIAVFSLIGYCVLSVFFWYSLRWLKGDRVERGSVQKLKVRPVFLYIINF